MFLNGANMSSNQDQDEIMLSDPKDQSDKFAFKGGFIQT
jgi:hypothetical protein